ncbi:hypothetical protein GCK72_008708 [Caenorhabditis remanei]|uniref:Cation efflux protein cytoplasmic domain-containing protein n=1 Tax=Caenorhabditis remanei TaxID=31234 RepID=A0A6A5H0E1_CAERE|nr:hypothetical protein GCK72_008708 [Caenorhabditis remanei]KAF1760459.1 hypothetical protein GCK72_008708 [Caenorhabditis remanei]
MKYDTFEVLNEVFLNFTSFFKWVHIVLDQNMSLKVTHDIAESLQTGIESLPEIERAFVHCDYEFEHHPQDEHKAV